MLDRRRSTPLHLTARASLWTRRSLFWAAARATVGVLVGCAALIAIPAHAADRYQQIHPPSVVVSGLHRLVILEVDTEYSVAAGHHIAAELTRGPFFQPDVTRMEPGVRADVITPIEVTSNALYAPDRMATLVAAHQAQAAFSVFGRVQEVEYETRTDQRTKTVTENGVSREVTYHVQCADLTVKSSIEWGLWDVAGAKIIGGTVEDTATTSGCGQNPGDSPPLATRAEMFRRSTIAEQNRILSVFAPHWVELKLAPQKDPTSGPTLDAFDRGNLVQAVDAATTVLAEDPFNATAVYHLGMALELGGESARAAPLHAYAARIRGDKRYDDAYARALRRTSELKVLADAFGIAPVTGALGKASPWVEAAQAALQVPLQGEPADVKGGRGVRVPVFASSDPGGEILVTLPGGSVLRRISDDGSMVHVQLPDGREGWVGVKAVK